MPVVIMLLFLSFAGTCCAEDPLESLNSVEDALNTMQKFLNAQASQQGSGKAARGLSGAGAAGDQRLSEDAIYFVGEKPLDAHGWVRVLPCREQGALSRTKPYPQSCVPAGERSGRRGNHFWKTREVSPADLQPGVMVVARDKANDGPWYLARIIDASEAASGYLSVSVPGRVMLDSVRVVH